MLVIAGLLACAGPSARALNPERQITQYGHDSWNYQNGLPGGAVYDIVQIADGYLWLRQASGLLRFDGLRFTRVTPEVAGAPVQEDVRALALTADQRIVLRTRNRILYLADGKFSDAVPPTRLEDGFDRVVHPARDGTFWLGADSNIHRVRNGVLEPIAYGSGWISTFCEDRQGTLWIGAGTGLYRLRGDTLDLFPNGFNEGVEQRMLPGRVLRNDAGLEGAVTSLLEDRHGVLWLGTHRGLYRIENDTLVRDDPTAPVSTLHISTLLEDRQGNLWVGTDGHGLYRRARGTWSHYSSREGLGDDGVCSLFEDAEGSLWIGTRAGLDRLRDTPLTTITHREGLSHDNAVVVTEGVAGEIYVYTFGGGITVMRDGRFTSLNRQDGLGSNHAGTLHAAPDGTLWIGSERGLFSYAGGRIRHHPDHGLLGNSYISAVASDGEGIVLGTSQLSLYRYRSGVFEPYPLGVPTQRGPRGIKYVYAMHRDDEGTLWFAMTAGLWKVRAGQRPEQAERTGYDHPVHALYDDGLGYLWLCGPETRGIVRLRKLDNQIDIFPAEAGILSGNIGRVVTDAQHNLWLGTDHGIVRIARGDIDAYAEGRAQTLATRVYGMVDGMKTDECAGSDQQPSAWRAKDGRLYFGTRKGLVVVEPDHLPRNLRIPPVVVENLVVDRRILPASGPVELPPGTANLEVYYTALSLLAPGRVHFKYQLEGFDRDWIDAGTRRTAYYTHLPPGKYRFRVIASNDDGIWNETGAAVSILLRPRLHQTVWFYVVCGLAVALLAFGLHRFRVRRLRRREAELVATVNERTATLRAEVAEHAEARRELQTYREYLEQLVTERTSALQESNLQLQREISERRLSEARYRSFFNDDLAGAFIATAAGTVVTYNPSFARMFRIDTSTTPAPLDFIRLFPNRADALSLVERLTQAGRLDNLELDLRRLDGASVSAEANLIASFAPRGELTEIKGYLVDTTERKRLETQLRQSQKMEAIGQLAGGVAHDFNNLLTAIIGSTDCILEDSAHLPEISRLAHDIREAGQRAASLTRQLLTFSRKQVLQPRTILINDVVVEMDSMLRRLLGEDIHLTCELAPDLPSVRADPSQMQQVLLNLTVNARDAMHRGGSLVIRTGTVSLSAPRTEANQTIPAGDFVRLSVIDSGSGMTAEVEAHLFEPFFTTKGVGKGTGLGLSTVYGIVQQSSGIITWETQPERGTAFHIYLPVVPGAPQPTPVPGSRSPFEQRHETILLVEDNELVLSVTLRYLRNCGFTVLPAENASAALQRCSEVQGRIDLLVTDLIMPDMNGKELADRITALHPQVKVLFMSGYTGDALGRVGEISDRVLLEKPFTASALIRRVCEVLDAPAGGAPVPPR